MSYVDGFVLPIRKSKLKIYKALAKRAGKIWIEHGALEYYEAIADDVPKGKLTSFPRSVILKPNEVVFFSWIVYKSRADRNRVMKKIMADPRFKTMDMSAFDGKRMIYGGFKTVVSLKK